MASELPTQSQTQTERTAIHWQRFAVPYEFPVVFTAGVLVFFDRLPKL